MPGRTSSLPLEREHSVIVIGDVVRCAAGAALPEMLRYRLRADSATPP